MHRTPNAIAPNLTSTVNHPNESEKGKCHTSRSACAPLLLSASRLISAIGHEHKHKQSTWDSRRQHSDGADVQKASGDKGNHLGRIRQLGKLAYLTDAPSLQAALWCREFRKRPASRLLLNRLILVPRRSLTDYELLCPGMYYCKRIRNEHPGRLIIVTAKWHSPNLIKIESKI